MTTLGNRIQTLRKQQGLSQDQLAELLQVSRQALSKWELDASIPALDHIMSLSQHFEVSTDFLLTGEECSASSPAPPVFQLELTPMPPRIGMVIGTILIAAGLLLGLLAIRTEGASFVLWLGILVQLAGCCVFHAACAQSKKNTAGQNMDKLPYLFYGINIWLLTPLPIMIVLPILLVLFFQTNLSSVILISGLMIPWLLCSSLLSFRWIKRYKQSAAQ